MTTPETQINAAMTIRRMDLDEADLSAVARLAALDSRAQLDGPVLGAEVDGRLLAAIAVASGDVVADPFSHTSELRALLKLRRTQVQNRGAAHHRRRSRLFGRSTRPAVGGSPAGEIIALPRVN